MQGNKKRKLMDIVKGKIPSQNKQHKSNQIKL